MYSEITGLVFQKKHTSADTRSDLAANVCAGTLRITIFPWNTLGIISQMKCEDLSHVLLERTR